MQSPSTSLKTRLYSALKIVAIYAVILGSLELIGQVVIRRIEARHLTPSESESLLTFNEPLIGFSLRKNKKTNLGLWQVTTNRWGFRDTEDFPLAKPSNEIRIAVVGGSTIFGWGVKDDDTVPAHLQQLINGYLAQLPGGSNKQVRVINAGCPWYASWHEAALIYFKVLEFSPDWVIVMDGLNDTAEALSPTWAPLAEGYVDLATNLSSAQRSAVNQKNNLLLGLLDLSPTLRYVYARLKTREQSKVGVAHPQVWVQYTHYMERMAHLTHDLGIRFSIYYQPVMHVDKPLDIFETSHDGTSMAIPEFREKFKALYLAGESKLLNDHELPVTSLKKLFAEEKLPIYYDGLHYNGKGNHLIAQAMFDHEIRQELPKLISSRLAQN